MTVVALFSSPHNRQPFYPYPLPLLVHGFLPAVPRKCVRLGAGSPGDHLLAFVSVFEPLELILICIGEHRFKRSRKS